MTSLSNTQAHFKPRGYAEHCSQSSRRPQDVSPRRWNLASKKRQKMIRERAFTCADTMRIFTSSRKERVCFLLEASRRYCFARCTQHGGVHPFQLCYFPPRAGAVGCSELKLFFFLFSVSIKHFYLVYLGD